MELRDRVVIVTGGAGGIGRALCVRFAAAGARAVVVADLDPAGAIETARLVTAASPATAARPRRCDVTDGQDVAELVAETVAAFGGVDLFVGNAGVLVPGGVDGDPAGWSASWSVNVMANVHAARAVLPAMLDRGDGYLLFTASAAGLLTSLGAAPYAATKAALVALAEWLAATYGDRGVRVSCLCPQGVRTDMLTDVIDRGELVGAATAAGGGVLAPDDVARAAVAGIAAEQFLIAPHPEVLDYERRKVADRDRWIRGMQRLRRRLTAADG